MSFLPSWILSYSCYFFDNNIFSVWALSKHFCPFQHVFSMHGLQKTRAEEEGGSDLQHFISSCKNNVSLLPYTLLYLISMKFDWNLCETKLHKLHWACKISQYSVNFFLQFKNKSWYKWPKRIYTMRKKFTKLV